MIDQSRLAPHRSLQQEAWRGILDRPPSSYRMTAAISHNDAAEGLFGVLELLRGQTIRPYLMVIDTGSPGPVVERLLAYEAEHDDFELHLVRGRGWLSPVQPVTVAMDLAFSACQTEFLYSTHADVFLRRPDALEFLMSLCSADHPAVGYQMSPRAAMGSRNDLCLGHSATVYHMPTMRRIGARWDVLASCERLGRDPKLKASWPDTEVNVSLDLLRAGYLPAWAGDPGVEASKTYLFVGSEPNHPYTTPLLRHERASASGLIYYRGTLGGQQSSSMLAAESARAPARVAEWRDYPPSPTLAEVLPVIRDCPWGDGCGPARNCHKLKRPVTLDDCLYCQTGPPDGEVFDAAQFGWSDPNTAS